MDGSRLFVIDRREGDEVVVIDPIGQEIHVNTQLLPPGCRSEGAVLRAPVHGASETVSWSEAIRDTEEENRRRSDYARRLRRLGSADEGGDVTL